MEFEWDEAKRQSNLAKHAIDFVRAELLFDGRPVVTTPSPYPGEERSLTTGIVDGLAITVIWTRRDGATRIISARRARDAETRTHRALHGGGA
jgi:uncharacterized DUF497 family protein